MDNFTDASGNGLLESPNGTSQDLSSQTGNEEDTITSNASDEFPHHNPLGVVANEHGEEHSHKRCCFESCSSGHCTPISNPT